MGRRNQNSQFYKEDGARQLFGANERQLKEGYSYEGGPDMVARGSVSVKKRVGAGRDGTSYKNEKRTIYSKETKAKAAAAAPAAKQAPAKPAVPKEQSQKIEPVKASPEVAQAKAKVQAYEKKDYSSIFKQNETDYTSKFQPSASQDTPTGAPQKDPQEFADKYKLNLSNAGGSQQTDTTSDKPMTGADILKNDKQQYGSYM